jgi:arginyl-tRNA synthetase
LSSLHHYRLKVSDRHNWNHTSSVVTDLAGYVLIQSPSLVQEFVDRLAAGIATLGLSAQPLIAIPIQPMPLSAGWGYASAIALQLASQSDHSALELAQQIIGNSSLDCVQASGWINYRLTEPAIADWLQKVTRMPPRLLESQPLVADENSGLSSALSPQLIFKLQYAHARCCSLLRLADRERLLQLSEPNPLSSPRLWQIVAPTSMPWLTSSGHLRLVHPQEKLLLQQLLEFPGWLAGSVRYSSMAVNSNSNQAVILTPWPPAPKAVERQIQLLCEGFYRHCRIWGEVKQENSELAIARLGLIAATHAVIHFWLRDLLGLDFSLEL